MPRERSSSERGASLAEMLVYISILVILLAVMTRTAVTLSAGYRSLKASQNIESAAISSMERMTRDIRGASSVNAASSSLGSSPGALSLAMTDASGNPKAERFYLSGGILRLDENGAYSGPLTPAGTTVTSLVFRQISTQKSKGIKIEMTIAAFQGKATTTRNFYDTAELRMSF